MGPSFGSIEIFGHSCSFCEFRISDSRSCKHLGLVIRFLLQLYNPVLVTPNSIVERLVCCHAEILKATMSGCTSKFCMRLEVACQVTGRFDSTTRCFARQARYHEFSHFSCTRCTTRKVLHLMYVLVMWIFVSPCKFSTMLNVYVQIPSILVSTGTNCIAESGQLWSSCIFWPTGEYCISYSILVKPLHVS